MILRGVQPIRRLVRVLVVLAALVLYAGLLPASIVQAGTLTVTTTVDEQTSPGVGCSLREAVAMASAAVPNQYPECGTASGGAADTINVPAGTYTLTAGQLNVNEDLTIIGAGANSTTISGNNASRVFWVSGGESLTLQNLKVANGSVDNEHGGGIYLTGGPLTVINSVITNNVAQNTANTDSRYGGGIYAPNSTVVIRDTTFSGNRVNANGGDGFGGAIAVVRGASLTVERSTFAGNEAHSNSGFGGAIYVELASATITNSTFTGNITRFVAVGAQGTPAFFPGGAINLGDGTLSIVNSTIASNTGQDTVGGVVQTGGTLSLRNTIVANNTGGNCLFPFPPSTNTNNLRWPQADMTCTGVPPGDPLLGTLANNGGPTQTMALSAGSAAIDKIASAGGCGVGVTTDQRGIARPQGTACDIGAYEYQAPPPPPAPSSGAAPKEVPEASTLLLLGGGLGGLATWLGWQRRKTR